MTTQPDKTLVIPTADSHPVVADWYASENAEAAVVVLCHGFKGHRRWGFFPYLADRLRRSGFGALVIDFSLNGTVATPGSRAAPYTVYQAPLLFERNTLARESDDLRRVVAFVREGRAGGVPPAVGLMGHSRGSVAVILAALELDDIGAICTWSASADPDFYSARQKKLWRRAGGLDFTDAADGAQLTLGLAYLDDLQENRERYLLRDRVAALSVPHLLVHGEMDLAVRPGNAQALFDAEPAATAKRLCFLRTGHTFGVPYPTPDPLLEVPPVLADAAGETCRWFAKFLPGGNSE